MLGIALTLTSFPSLLEDLDVDKLKTSVHAALVLYGEHHFGWKASWDLNPEWYCLTFDSRRKCGIWVKPTCQGRGSPGHAPSLRVQH